MVWTCHAVDLLVIRKNQARKMGPLAVRTCKRALPWPTLGLSLGCQDGTKGSPKTLIRIAIHTATKVACEATDLQSNPCLEQTKARNKKTNRPLSTLMQGKAAGHLPIFDFFLVCAVLRRMPMHKVVRRPGTRKLHPALLQLQRRRRILVLVPLHRLVIDQVRDVQQHLA